jgi:hypothetical protein
VQGCAHAETASIDGDSGLCHCLNGLLLVSTVVIMALCGVCLFVGKSVHLWNEGG